MNTYIIVVVAHYSSPLAYIYAPLVYTRLFFYSYLLSAVYPYYALTFDVDEGHAPEGGETPVS